MTAALVALLALLCVTAVMLPRYALLLVLVFFPLEQLLQAYSPFFVARASFVNLAVGISALLAVLRSMSTRDSPLVGSINPLMLATVAFYMFVFLGLVYTPSPASANRFVRGNYPYYGLMLVLFPLLATRLDQVRAMLVPFLVVGSMVATAIIVSPSAKVEGGRLFVEISTPGSSERIKANPLETATLGALLTITGILFNPRTKNPLILIIRVGATVAGLGIAVLAGGRGQLIAAFVTVLALFPFARQVRNIGQFVLVAGGAVVVLGFMGLIVGLFLNSGSGSRWGADSVNDALTDRFSRITQLLTAWSNDPVAWFIGLGPAAMNHVLGTEGDLQYPHNILAEVLGSHGLIGFGLFTLVCVLAGLAARKLWELYADDPIGRSAAMVLAGWALFSLLIALKQGSYLAIPAPFYFFLLLAKLASTESAMAWRYSQHALDAEPPDAPVPDPDTDQDHPDDGGLGAHPLRPTPHDGPLAPALRFSRLLGDPDPTPVALLASTDRLAALAGLNGGAHAHPSPPDPAEPRSATPVYGHGGPGHHAGLNGSTLTPPDPHPPAPAPLKD
ncbi:MAG: hypothetical protein C0475_04700 [Planctomyces sp.]|nr:hypothetical protein [Planctomyces sp.]